MERKSVILLVILSVALLFLALMGTSFYRDVSPTTTEPDQEAIPEFFETPQPPAPETPGFFERIFSDSPETDTDPTTGETRTYCTDDSREVESCEPNDHPICGWFDQSKITCESGPCVRSTFPNECEACMNPTILYWTEDECPVHE